MLMRYWQAAILAATVALAVNAARAEDPSPAGGSGDCCKDQGCCKDKACGKTGPLNQSSGNILNVNRNALYFEIGCKDTKGGTAKKCCGKDGCCKDQGCCKSKACGKTGCTYIFNMKCTGASATYDCGIQSPAGKTGACCKNEACCKDKPCCTAKESCCKDGCCKDGCCKDGKDCCKSKECCKGKCGADSSCCCAPKSKRVKKRTTVTPIIVVVPVPMPSPAMPVCGSYSDAAMMQFRQPYVGYGNGYGMPLPPPPPMLSPPGLPQPPMPPSVGMSPPPGYGYPPCGTGMCVPAMPCPNAVLKKDETGVDSYLSLLGVVSDLCCSRLQPPTLPSMCLSALGMATDLCSQTWSGGMTIPSGEYMLHPPQYTPPSPLPMPRPLMAQGWVPSPTAIPCSVSEPLLPPTPTSKVCITANASDAQLEMSIDEDEACLSSKKMTLKVGGRRIVLTTVDGKVQFRAGELGGKADCVRTDRKDCLILEGNAVLHCRKDGQAAQVIKAGYIEVNLATGCETLKSVGNGVERIGVNFH